MPSIINGEATFEASPQSGSTLAIEVEHMFKRIAPRSETTVTVKFNRHEVGDLAHRARAIENFGSKFVWLPNKFAGRGISDLTPEELLTALAFNAAMQVRGIKTEGFAEAMRFWTSFQQDESLFCISFVLPAVPAIARRPEVMRSG